MARSLCGIGRTICMGLVAAFAAAPLCGTTVSAQAPGDRATADRAVRDGACAASRGSHAEARRHLERAMQLDPADATLPLLVANAAEREYHDAEDTPAGPQKAREAVAAYERVLARDPNDEAALFGISSVYRVSGDAAKASQVILDRAALETLPRERRARLYYHLAVYEWEDAHTIIRANEVRNPRRPDLPSRYRKPQDPAVLAKLRGHVSASLDFVDRAIALGFGADAWAYRKIILLEAARLAEMEARPRDKASYESQAREAEAAYRKEVSKQFEASREAELREERRRAEESAGEVAEFVRSGGLRRELNVRSTADLSPYAGAVAPPPPPPPPPVTAPAGLLRSTSPAGS